jgi:hypothetical protein
LTQTVTEIKDTKLELETFAGRTLQAWNDAAREAKLVLRQPADEHDSGDYPDRIYSQLRRFRRVMSRSQGEPKRVITHMARQLVNTKDEKGRPTKKEYLTYQGYYEVTDHRGLPYQANIDAGKFEKPKIVVNPGRKYDPNTGLPIGPEFVFSNSETFYTIEVPQSKTERAKLIKEIIADNFPESIKYYYKSHDELARRDDTFTADEFINDTIDELRKKSFSSSGGKSPGIWRDNDGIIRDKFGQKLSQISGNKEAYQ